MKTNIYQDMKNVIVYLLVFVGIQLCVTSGIQKIWQLIAGNGDITANMLIVSMSAAAAITLVVFIFAGWCKIDRSYMRSSPWGVLFWCFIAAAGAVIPSAWLQEQLPELPNVMLPEFTMIMRSPWGYLAVGLLAPVVEEIVFRGAVLKSLLKAFRGHWAAIAVSSVLFAIVHGNPAQMPHAFIVGLLLGWMYWRTGSIVPGVAYHWVNNTIAYILCNIMPDPDIPLIVLFNGSNTRVILAVVFSLCLLLPALFQLNMRLKRI
ncbi:CPBP family intramembrane glutamic endopeptidase [Xylanibacter muris]|uniref:CPBP family intramembrane metalloprotease n=1 Tax=Xylanibacter muris TaxID=2736290 RepID=A0ABX2APR3_9BACT|nr:type II CAAX endopeptidase family protein [Xylanibacter muris]NPD92537.1 CPBP family intramembrane metalloprotease [Xylanibacter muris]